MRPGLTTAVRLGYLVVAMLAWLPTLVLAYSLGDGRIWLALGLSALGGCCATIAWRERPAPSGAAERLPAPSEAPPVAEESPVRPAGEAEGATADEVPPAAEPPVAPDVAAWVAAAEAAMRPRPRAAAPPLVGAPRPETPDPAPDAAQGEAVPGAPPVPAAARPPGSLAPAGQGLDARLSGLAARQRAHTSDLRRSIRSAIERHDK